MDAANTRSPGRALDAALSSVFRWTTRPEVSRTLSGDAELTSTDAWLLERLESAGPSRMSRLAEWQGVDRSTMTAHVRRLEERGLVARAADAADRRASVISISDAGRAERLRGHEAALVVFDALVADWSQRDRRELVRLLDKLAAEVAAAADRA